MKRFITALLLLGCLFFTSSAKAQDLLPQIDSTTYRQFFVIATQDHSTLPGAVNDNHEPLIPSKGISDRQLGILQSASLEGLDRLVAAGVLLDFRVSYDQLVLEYNNLPATLAGTNEATPAFLGRLENLVQATVYKLNDSLSVAGVVNLNRYLQTSKRGQSSSDLDTSLVAAKTFSRSKGGKPPTCTYTPHYTTTFNKSDNYPVDNSVKGSLPVTNWTSAPYSYITQSGLSHFYPQQLVDSNTTTTGWDTNGAVSNSYIEFAYNNIGAPAIVQAQVYAMSAGYSTTYNIDYSNDNITWIYTGFSFVPNLAGWNTVTWGNVGSHLYYRLSIPNTPFPNEYIMEAKLQKMTDTVFFNTQLTEGYSDVSGTCENVKANNLLWVETLRCNVTSSSVSPTSWISWAHSKISTILKTTDVIHEDKWIAKVWTAVTTTIIWSSNNGSYEHRYYEFAYTRTREDDPHYGTNCSIPTGRVCDFAQAEWCTAETSPPDMHISKVRYDWTITYHPWGWEVYGIMSRPGTSGFWTPFAINITEWAFPTYGLGQPLASCSHHP
jgi:hypothetical protein